MRFRAFAAAALGLAAISAGCGGDDNSNTTSQATQPAQTQTATQPQTSQGQTPKAEKVTPTAGEANISRKPEVPKGKGSPPSSLQVQDLIVGKGKTAKQGNTVSVQYVGVLFDNGKEFDASWNGKKPGKAFQFPLGAGQVIPGWDQGVAGMKVGGRRKLIIPPDLAYGPQGVPGIPPNSTLIFDVDLKKVGG